MEGLFVEAFPGDKGEATPRAFTYEGSRRQVRQVLARWYRNEHTYFRVCADDGCRYVIRRDEDTLRWELVMQEGEAP